jgi:hypothetical protein
MNIKTAADYTQDARGMFAGIPMEQYQAVPALSASGCATLNRSPLDFLRQRNGELRREPSEAMELGTVYHAGLFEGRRDYYIQPDTYPAPESAKKDAPIIQKPWNNNAAYCKAWALPFSDKPIYSSERAAEIEAGIDYVRRHPQAAQLLAKDGMCEVSIFARQDKWGHALKGRPDKIWFEDGKVFVADLKTTNDASTREISRTILHRRYHVQAAMYRYLLAQLGFEHGGHTLIFFEPGNAPKCNVRHLCDAAIDMGEEQLTRDLELYHCCRIASDWPEWADAEGDNIGYIDLPEYVYGEQTLDMAQ